MQQALREAETAYEKEEVPVGAVIVIKNRIVARGHNQVECLNDPTAHAEMIALTAAFNALGSKYLPEASIYVTVEPCIMCAGALYWSKIGRVVWGAMDEKNGFRGSMRADWSFHPKTLVTTGVLEDHCSGIIKQFFRQRRGGH